MDKLPYVRITYMDSVNLSRNADFWKLFSEFRQTLQVSLTFKIFIMLN